MLQELKRGRVITTDPESGAALRFASPEDTVLQKLRGYRLGNETSKQQWLDVLGVLRVQAGALDEAYLDEWAPALGVADLLARARTDAKA